MRFYTKQHQYYCGIDLHARKMRSTRDLMRRRNHLMRKRSELLAHIQNTNSQYNLPEFKKKIAYKTNRYGVAEHFNDPSVCKSIQVNVALIYYYDKLLNNLELFITRTAKEHDVNAYYRLRSVPGIGKILAHKLARAVYYILKRKTAFDMQLFLSA